MAKLKHIELGDGTRIAVLYEDRSILAVDKPAGWLLAPDSWDRTGRNLQLALLSAIRSEAPWARSRRIQFLRFIHRLDGETSGVLLLARSPAVLRAFSLLFASQMMDKTYLAVVEGVPNRREWVCELSLGPDPGRRDRMRVERAGGKPAVTRFTLIRAGDQVSLVKAKPLTGRTHQIRVHLAAAGHPVVGDLLYGPAGRTRPKGGSPLGLRAWELAYTDPFHGRNVRVRAPIDEFCRTFGLDAAALAEVSPRGPAMEGRAIAPSAGATDSRRLGGG